MDLADFDDKLLLDWAARIPGETLAEKLAVPDGGGLGQAFRSRYAWLAYRNLPRRYLPLPKEQRSNQAPPPARESDWAYDRPSREWRRKTRSRPSRQPPEYDDSVPVGRWQLGG